MGETNTEVSFSDINVGMPRTAIPEKSEEEKLRDRLEFAEQRTEQGLRMFDGGIRVQADVLNQLYDMGIPHIAVASETQVVPLKLF